MIDSALTAGCLQDTLKEFMKQELNDKKFLRWVVQGGNMSYADFWSKIKNG